MQSPQYPTSPEQPSSQPPSGPPPYYPPPSYPVYVPVYQPQERRRLPTEAIVIWCIAIVSLVLTLIAVVLLITTAQPSTLQILGCGVGDQNSCNEINTLTQLHRLGLVGTIVGTLVTGVFVVWAFLVTAFRRS
jgi:hypothetical protein